MKRPLRHGRAASRAERAQTGSSRGRFASQAPKERTTATSQSVTRPGIQDIDALLEGSRWNTGNLTFSFPARASFCGYSGEPDNSFAPVASELQTAVRAALAAWSSVANLTFTEITETSSRHADMHFGMSDLTAIGNDRGGEAFFPDQGVPGGDVWLQADDSLWNPPFFLGAFAFFALMHEIGHALGFQHPTGLLEPSHDGWDYSLMDYRAFPGQPTPFTYPFVPA